MRHVHSSLGVSALMLAAAILAGCSGSTTDKTATKTDSAAAAPAAAPAPAPVPQDSYSLVAKDGSWNVDITPATIVFHKKGAKKDQTFDYKPPVIDGAITNFDIVKTQPDTHTFGARIAMTTCTDNQKKQYTHLAQVWVDKVAYSGCGVKK
jgi:hypothetical protein